MINLNLKFTKTGREIKVAAAGLTRQLVERLNCRNTTLDEFTKDRQRLNEILGKHCKKTADQVAAETERDHYFTAKEAKDFGLVDEVVEKVVEKK